MTGGFYIDVNLAAGKPSEGQEIFQRAPDFTAANVMLWSDEPMIVIDARTVVLGYLFRKGPPSVRVRKGAGEDGSALAAANGRALITGYWGGYVFVHVTEDGALYVLRDPSGLLPCYLRRSGRATALACDVTDLAAPGLGRVNFEEIGRILASGDARGRNTCLAGVEELIAGECLVVDQRSSRIERWWSPWDHVAPRKMSTGDETSQLCETISDCVGSWSSCFPSILLGSSGGLDSSIVAVAATPRSERLTALTLVSPGAAGDERPYAHAVASSLGIPLRDAPLDLADIDVERAVTPHHPWPISPIFKQAVGAVHRRLQSEMPTDAHFSGNGGDGIFCSIRSAVPLLDHFLSKGQRTGLGKTVRDISSLTGADIVTVLRHAWLRHRRSGGAHLPRYNELGLEREMLARIEAQGFSHPWLSAPADALPGKTVHVAFLMRAQKSLELYPRRSAPLHIAPLLSQPIVERCLAIPTWRWIADGRDRAVARAAFSNRLPRTIIERQQKGGPAEFSLSIYRTQRDRLHELIRDGVLAAAGIIDISLLDEPEDISWRGNAREQRILAFAAAESWARHWNGG
ncbi:Asparagine synthase [uncultured Sphingopyxis sp.]|uniref:asparagine synthase (glutamine-hydrolyzing) n=1 Tax=uncultured Sphingopyxis sp. TaxID=310581 RepID=A0A1Y5PRW9_9SPHN|nr:asparagine synthase C-terminal domain-containing protein [uncultured Sphingopyxis sp.]SBV32738.1 Asparagine synthase [uncultured Sphingopyxis sp.]